MTLLELSEIIPLIFLFFGFTLSEFSIFGNGAYFTIRNESDEICADNQSETTIISLPEVSSCDVGIGNCDDLWNNQKYCIQQYYQLIPKNESLYVQFHIRDRFHAYPFDGENSSPINGIYADSGYSNLNYFIKIRIADGCCNILENQPEYFIERWWIMQDNTGRNYQTLQMNIENLPNCFQFVIEEYQISNITNRPEAGPINTYFTEPYKKINCEEYVTIRGIHPRGQDCIGKWHGQPVEDRVFGVSDAADQNTDIIFNDPTISPRPIRTWFEYDDVIYLEGSFEDDSFTIEKEESENERVLISHTDAFYRLRTTPIPPYMVERLIGILAGQEIEVEGNRYKFSGEVPKNNEFSLMWNIDIKFNQKICRFDFKCTTLE